MRLLEELVQRVKLGLARLERAQAGLDFAHQAGIGAHGVRLLPAVVLVGAHQHRDRTTVPGDDDFLVTAADFIDQTAQFGLGFGQGEGFQGVTCN